jgi:hypothetical protein
LSIFQPNLILAHMRLPMHNGLKIGYGGSGRLAANAESNEQLSIGQIGRIFRVDQKGQKPPPKGIKDLLPLEKGYPRGLIPQLVVRKRP